MPSLCALCDSVRALVKRPKTGQPVCKQCFFDVFEEEVHQTISHSGDGGGSIFARGEKVAIGASGGKGEWQLACNRYSTDARLDGPRARPDTPQCQVRLWTRPVPPLH